MQLIYRDYLNSTSKTETYIFATSDEKMKQLFYRPSIAPVFSFHLNVRFVFHYKSVWTPSPTNHFKDNWHTMTKELYILCILYIPRTRWKSLFHSSESFWLYIHVRMFLFQSVFQVYSPRTPALPVYP